jgi:hypothetical protein
VEVSLEASPIVDNATSMNYSFPRKDESNQSLLLETSSRTIPQSKFKSLNDELVEENAKLKEQLDLLNNQNRVQELLIKTGFNDNPQAINTLE